jgi:hypothetical protein
LKVGGRGQTLIVISKEPLCGDREIFVSSGRFLFLRATSLSLKMAIATTCNNKKGRALLPDLFP